MPATTDTPKTVDLLVRRDDWRQCRFDTSPTPEVLSPGEVLFRLDRLALTANDVTYALTGDMLGYWRFFPADPPWGRLPVMGFADVVRSAHPDVTEGERGNGFFPMSTHLVIDTDAVHAVQFVDAAAHRQDTALAAGLEGQLNIETVPTAAPASARS